MESSDSEFWINFIIADYLPFTLAEKSYYLQNPSRDRRFFAEELFLDYYHKSLADGCLGEEDIEKLLKKRKIWTDKKEEQLKNLIKDTEKIKISMYEAYLNSTTVKQLRSALRSTEKLIDELAQAKSTFDNYSARAIALYCKQNFLLGCSIFTGKNKPYWRRPQVCWDNSDTILAAAYQAMNKYHLTDSDYRELARSSVWKNIWNVRKNAGNIFGKPLVDLTAAQRHLIAWSNLYESVYNHSNPPAESVIEDDDLLDGWMLFQKRKRDNDLGKAALNERLNPKIAQSDEVFIMTGSDELSPVGKDQFDLVYEMNDLQGKMAFKRRMAQIAKEGIVPESDMKETQEQIRMQAAALQQRKG